MFNIKIIATSRFDHVFINTFWKERSAANIRLLRAMDRRLAILGQSVELVSESSTISSFLPSRDSPSLARSVRSRFSLFTRAVCLLFPTFFTARADLCNPPASSKSATRRDQVTRFQSRRVVRSCRDLPRLFDPLYALFDHFSFALSVPRQNSSFLLSLPRFNILVHRSIRLILFYSFGLHTLSLCTRRRSTVSLFLSLSQLFSIFHTFSRNVKDILTHRNNLT